MKRLLIGLFWVMATLWILGVVLMILSTALGWDQ